MPALPTLVVIGAMKGGTSAMHEYLDAHPQVVMSRPKELNFFTGPRQEWDRGVDWYAAQFDAASPARGESSPGYTSPSFPGTAERMATVVPEARLVYLVRDPFARALSQYAHHRRDGDETRAPDEALLDPDSQYVARSRYLERLQPFLDRFGTDQVHVVVQERLRDQRLTQVRRVYEHVGVDPGAVDEDALDRLVHRGDPPPATGPDLRRRFWARVADDVDALRDHLHDDLEEWEAA